MNVSIRKGKKIKYSYLLIMCAFFVTGCDSSENEKSSTTTNFGLLKNADLVVQKIDEDKLETSLEELEVQAKEAETFEDYQKWIQQKETILAPLQHNINVLSIRTTQNIHDEKQLDELGEAEETLESAEKKINEMIQVHLEKDYGEKVLEELKQTDPVLVRQLQVLKNDEQANELSELREKLRKCKYDFDDKKATQETVYNGKTYNITNLGQKSNASDIEYHYYDELLALYKERIAIEKRIAEILGYTTVIEMFNEDLHRTYGQEEMETYFTAIKTYFSDQSQSYNDSETAKLTQSIENIAYQSIGNDFKKIDNELYEVWNTMINYKLLDIAPSENKYQNWGAVMGNKPELFLIGNLDNTSDDLQTFIHEFAHFFALAKYNSSMIRSNEVEEIYSQAFESLMSYKLDDYTKDAKTQFVTRIFMNQVINMAFMQEYQIRIYESENLTLEEMERIDTQLSSDYYKSDTEGSKYAWVDFIDTERPCSEMEYFYGAIIALQLHEVASENYTQAWEQYMVMVNNTTETDARKIALAAGLNDPAEAKTLEQVSKYLTSIV